MATSRPSSLIIPSGIFDETNTNNNSKKSSLNQPAHSSSSSVDSGSANNVTTNDNINSSTQSFIRTATSSTTTDSDLESEQEDQNQSQTQKSDRNSQEQLSRRMKNFRKLFKSEIKDNMPELIDSYVCAYQGDILLQGKMYITDRYLCFHSRIISYVTKHVYRWEQIEDVTKERVAFIFPTAVGIQLKNSDKKIIYASFLQRDQAFEKIQFVWSRAINDMSSCDDDGSDIVHDGTLKAINQQNGPTNKYKRDSYDIIDGPEENGVLDLCLKNNNKRPISLISTKSNEKQQTKILTNSYNKKSSEQHNHLNEKLSNDSNSHQTNRYSRQSKYEKKQNNSEQRNSSLVNHNRSKPNSVKYRQNQSQERTSLSTDHQTNSHLNSSPSVTSSGIVPIVDSKSNGISTKRFNLVDFGINFITETIPSIINHLQSLPLKTTTCILLFFLLLFFHAFYLMKVANRIEHRLQSLHHLWPSSSPDKHSLVSNPKEL